jgi:hypothetical protein
MQRNAASKARKAIKHDRSYSDEPVWGYENAKIGPELKAGGDGTQKTIRSVKRVA